MGHVLDVRGAYSSAMGRDQAILVDTASGMHFASDPRADGSAEPEPPPHP
jgi:gamma-glutamyltranspeptidase